MRQGEEPDLPPDIPPIPWCDNVGVCSSGTEVVYDSPEEYEENEPRAPSLSPATIKRRKALLEMDMDKMSSWSDQYDPTGKTPEQLDALIGCTDCQVPQGCKA